MHFSSVPTSAVRPRRLPALAITSGEDCERCLAPVSASAFFPLTRLSLHVSFFPRECSRCCTSPRLLGTLLRRRCPAHLRPSSERPHFVDATTSATIVDLLKGSSVALCGTICGSGDSDNQDGLSRFSTIQMEACERKCRQMYITTIALPATSSTASPPWFSTC